MTTSTKDKEPTFMDEQAAIDRFNESLPAISKGANELSTILKIACGGTEGVSFSHQIVDRAVDICAQLAAALTEAKNDVEGAGLEW